MSDFQLDPSHPDFKNQVEQTLTQYAEEYSIEKYPAEHRNHLGISIIGKQCRREIWSIFRWLKLEQYSGRMRRLFQRGHDEEEKFENFLLWAGIRISSINPETNKQYRLSLVDGHYGGSADGIGLLSWANDLPLILEYKTHNNKLFTELKNKKLKEGKPQHYAQMCGYGKDFKVKYGLYFAINKDTDEWYTELIELDWNYALELENKAADIIYSQTPPAKIAENSSYYACKFCTFKGLCFEGEAPEKNCRSCKQAQPVANGKWFCNWYKQEIPKDFIAKGCNDYAAIV